MKLGRCLLEGRELSSKWLSYRVTLRGLRHKTRFWRCVDNRPGTTSSQLPAGRHATPIFRLSGVWSPELGSRLIIAGRKAGIWCQSGISLSTGVWRNIARQCIGYRSLMATADYFSGLNTSICTTYVRVRVSLCPDSKQLMTYMTWPRCPADYSLSLKVKVKVHDHRRKMLLRWSVWPWMRAF